MRRKRTNRNSTGDAFIAITFAVLGAGFVASVMFLTVHGIETADRKAVQKFIHQSRVHFTPVGGISEQS